MPTQNKTSPNAVKSTLNDLHATISKIAEQIFRLEGDIKAAAAACQADVSEENMNIFANEIFRNNLLANMHAERFVDLINHMNGMIGRFDAQIAIVPKSETQKSAN